MFNFDIDGLRKVLAAVIADNVSADAFEWLNTCQTGGSQSAIKGAFVQLPRKSGKAGVVYTDDQLQKLNAIRPGFTIKGWPIDKSCRVYLLIAIDNTDREKYFQLVEDLFSAAEMNEQVALYAAMPVLPYPELWIKRCAEGIRSNIGSVLEAIMYQNPYPAERLDEAAWNQMVLKAFFTEKQIAQITGLDERANNELARILVDYAKERHAAGRNVDPMLWYLAGKFVDAGLLAEMQQGRF